jgi:response regulator RpfG family c-di-GMP phosphodiesterase
LFPRDTEKADTEKTLIFQFLFARVALLYDVSGPCPGVWINPVNIQQDTLKILIVDDNLSLIELLRELLESQSCIVHTASHTMEALSLCDRESFDVMLVDVHLPGLNGIEFLRRLPKNNSRAIKIVMSGDATIDEVVNSFHQEIDDFLIKPITTTAIVWHAIERQRYKIQLEQELKFKNKVMLCYHEILQCLNSHVDIKSFCDYLFKTLKDILPLTRMELLLLDSTRKHFFIHHLNSDIPLLPPIKDWVEVEGSGFEFSLQNGGFKIIPNMGANGFHETFLNNAQKEGMQSALLFPLHMHNTIYGWMNFYSLETNSYIDKHVTILEGILPNLPVSFERALYQGKLTEENTFLRQHLKTLFHQLLQQQEALIFSLAELAEERDKETGAHLQRMSEFSRLLAERYFSDQTQADLGYGMMETKQIVDMIFKTAPLHDIGKVGIPDFVLLKIGKLSPEEFAIMRTHTVIGAECLAKAYKRAQHSPFLLMGRDIVLYHHEKWDGTGYPENLQGLNIPLVARIIAIADNYDALRSKRIYKPAWDHLSTCQYFKSQKGLHFDPNLIDMFLEIEKEFEKTYSKYSLNEGNADSLPVEQFVLSL